MPRDLILGVCLGVGIGVLTGLVLVVLLRIVAATSPRHLKRIMALTGEVPGLATFWLGAPWVTTKLLEDLDWEDVIGWYVASLVITVIIIVIFPLVRFIIRTGRGI